MQVVEWNGDVTYIFLIQRKEKVFFQPCYFVTIVFSHNFRTTKPQGKNLKIYITKQLYVITVYFMFCKI